LRIDLAQYRELAAFAQFGSDLDKATQSQLERGKRLTEILKQPQYQPMEVEDQIIIIWTVTNGYGDDIAVEDLKRFEHELLDNIKNAHPGARNAIRERKVIDDVTESGPQPVPVARFQGDAVEFGSGRNGSSRRLEIRNSNSRFQIRIWNLESGIKEWLVFWTCADGSSR
jgi:hypothetical protein